MAKHLIDLGEDCLNAARAELGTTTIQDTVNNALRRVSAQRDHTVRDKLDTLGAADLEDRRDAWH